jgi:hypothetical protein
MIIALAPPLALITGIYDLYDQVATEEGFTPVESAEGLLVNQGGVDAKTRAWWETLSSEEKQQAAVEARAYEQLSEAEQDALWNEGADTLDDAEDDELELPAP